MEKFYIIDEDGEPVLVDNEKEYAAWAVENKREMVTDLGTGKDGIPLYVITSFNYREGYFMTFKNGAIREELEKSETKYQADKTHEKWVNELSV
jgi:hypothetical protein